MLKLAAGYPAASFSIGACATPARLLTPGRLGMAADLLCGQGAWAWAFFSHRRVLNHGWKATRSISDRCCILPRANPGLPFSPLAIFPIPNECFSFPCCLTRFWDGCGTQPGTSSLRAILYMDEIFGYFPPVGNPPSKTPLLTLLKQARAFGLGVVLSTQNPVDLDYKGLANTGTWFIGRLQTERDKGRVLEGLEGAAAGSGFDRGQMEEILAGLGKRIFLLHNVHENEPAIFQTRWALSYLRGPMTREQIKVLMAQRKSQNHGHRHSTCLHCSRGSSKTF